jgi:hypothetical protein
MTPRAFFLFALLTCSPATVLAQTEEQPVELPAVQVTVEVPAGQPPAPQGQPVYVQPGYPQSGYGTPVYTQPVYVQPGYGQPVYVQPGYGEAGYVQPYRPVRARPRGRGMIVGGVLSFTIPYVFSVFAGVLMLSSYYAETQQVGAALMVPGVGPFIGAGIRATSMFPPTAFEIAVLIVDGVLQSGGIALTILAAWNLARNSPPPNSASGRSRSVQWALTPMVAPGSTGLSLSVAHF